jgi:hypothetical protein
MVVSFTQPAVPAGYSTFLSSGPSGAVLTCSPSPRAATASETLTWYATGMGCPNRYAYSSIANRDTCIATSSKTLDLFWDCDYIVPITISSTLDGDFGSAVPRTGATKLVVVTQTPDISPPSLTIDTFHTPAASAQKRKIRSTIRPGLRNHFARADSYFQCPQNDYWCRFRVL